MEAHLWQFCQLYIYNKGMEAHLHSGSKPTFGSLQDSSKPTFGQSKMEAHLCSLEDLPSLEAYLWHHGSPPKENGSQSDRKSPPSFRIEAHLWQSWKNLRSLEAFSGCKGSSKPTFIRFYASLCSGKAYLCRMYAVAQSRAGQCGGGLA